MAAQPGGFVGETAGAGFWLRPSRETSEPDVHLVMENCTQLAERCSPGRHHGTDVLQKEQLLPVAGRRHSPTTSVYSKGAKSLVPSFRPLRCSPWVPLSADREACVLLLLQLPSRILFCKVSASSGCCSWAFREPTVDHGLLASLVSQCVWYSWK